MQGFVAAFETALGYRFPEPTGSGRSREERPRRARGRLALGPLEGPVSQHLGTWRVPCLICAGEADEMHDAARQAAEEIPGARFVSLAGHSHISAFYEADDLLLPHILELLRSTLTQP